MQEHAAHFASLPVIPLGLEGSLMSPLKKDLTHHIVELILSMEDVCVYLNSQPRSVHEPYNLPIRQIHKHFQSTRKH